jgi:hypothetical protein
LFNETGKKETKIVCKKGCERGRSGTNKRNVSLWKMMPLSGV